MIRKEPWAHLRLGAYLLSGEGHWFSEVTQKQTVDVPNRTLENCAWVQKITPSQSRHYILMKFKMLNKCFMHGIGHSRAFLVLLGGASE